MIFDAAWRIHDHACDRWRGLPDDIRDPRIARPWDTPSNMPPHRWRVSPDVMQALWNASPPAKPIPNPKNSDYSPVPLLFGWPLVKDEAAPAGTMLLEPLE